MFSNHMHEWGMAATSELIRQDGEVIMLREGPLWTYEMQFQAEWTEWGVDTPLQLKAGDVIRTTCHWMNTTDAKIAFPREMCFGVGYYLSDGSSSLVCLDGNWAEL